jgi:hypothetical protein
MAADGVVRIAAGQPTSCLLLVDWRREAEQFERLRELRFFRHFLSCRCFCKWRQVSECGDAPAGCGLEGTSCHGGLHTQHCKVDHSAGSPHTAVWASARCSGKAAAAGQTRLWSSISGNAAAYRRHWQAATVLHSIGPHIPPGRVRRAAGEAVWLDTCSSHECCWDATAVARYL